ncbi:hypothetical protein JOC77_004085 [Peribacillus deserti]|uniref:DUF3993 domain-containing protein n=1 Tax=Peribacillus deserti TaxID=673318 RepID=A0ABS2QN69_9BACI|nr:DUF3993 domain-containing protein [Peribacillus deserti]MBM7694610.1 hypothetical protein [Peribacillus deserti]
MKKTLLLLIASMSLFLAAVSSSVSANSSQETKAASIHKNSVMSLLNDAFVAQVSLSYEGQSLEEVNRKLEPFFTEGFIEKFIDQNIVNIDGQYKTLGSDAAIYYIPFFSYDDKTKIVPGEDKGTLIVTEHFGASTDGPVGYEEHDENVLLIKDGNKWKISDITSSMPANEAETEDADEEANPESAATILPQAEDHPEAVSVQISSELEENAHIVEYTVTETLFQSKEENQEDKQFFNGAISLPSELRVKTEDAMLGFGPFFSSGYNMIMNVLNTSKQENELNEI